MSIIYNNNNNNNNDGGQLFDLKIRELLSFNTELLIMKNGFSIKEILERSESYHDMRPISRMVIHSFRTGEKIPGIDKLFIFGRTIDANPKEFLEPRENQITDKFLSLSLEERRNRIRVLIH